MNVSGEHGKNLLFMIKWAGICKEAWKDVKSELPQAERVVRKLCECLEAIVSGVSSVSDSVSVSLQHERRRL